MTISTRKRRLIMSATAFLLVGAVAFVYAAWTSNSTGSGYAKATNQQDLTFTQPATAAQLYPGGSGDVKIELTNPNPYAVTVTDVVRTAGAVTGSGGTGTCTTTGVTVEDVSGLTFSLAAGATGILTLSNKAHMNNTSDSGCQGAVFEIPVRVTAVSDASNTSPGS